MRRAIYVLVVLAVAAVMYYISRPRSAAPPNPPDMALVEPVLDSATVRVPEYDVTVKLSDGHAEFESGPVRGTVAMDEVFAHMRTETGYDILGVLQVSGGGSGTFSYLVLFYRPTPDSLEHRDSILLGDRVKVRDIRTEDGPGGNGYQVVATVLDRRENEPMSAPPTVEQEMAFTVNGHRLVQ